MGLREQSIVGCFPEFGFQFSVVHVLVGLRKQCINNFVFPTWACAVGFNNNNKVEVVITGSPPPVVRVITGAPLLVVRVRWDNWCPSPSNK